MSKILRTIGGRKNERQAPRLAGHNRGLTDSLTGGAAPVPRAGRALRTPHEEAVPPSIHPRILPFSGGDAMAKRTRNRMISFRVTEVEG